MLIRVSLSYLCAGVIAEEGRIIRAAPILSWSVGKRPEDLSRWVRRKGGHIEVVERW